MGSSGRLNAANLFIEHRVYQHLGDKICLFVCFENLESGQFCVQQAEFFYFGDVQKLTSLIKEFA